MSWDAMIAVMDGSHAKGAAFAVLLAVAKSATEVEGWKSYLSVEEIAERARVTVRAARRSLRDAEALGELHVNIMAGRQGVNLWRLETGLLMRQALARYPDRRYTLDGTGNTPDRTSVGRTLGPWTPDRRSLTPDRRSVTPDRRSPGEGFRGSLEGEGEGARTATRGDAADSPPQEAVELRSPLGASPRLPSGDPQDGPWDETALGATWERGVKNAGAQVHNGQGDEWAHLATDIGCETKEEAAWMVRAAIKLGKREQPERRKPWALSELIGYRDDLRRLLRERRLLTITKQGTAS